MPAPRVSKGQRYGRWTVQAIEAKELTGAIRWQCLCDCGTVKAVRASSLTSGTTNSCGCLNGELSRARMKAQAAQIAQRTRQAWIERRACRELVEMNGSRATL